MSQAEHYQAVLAASDRAGVYHMPQVAPEPLTDAAATVGLAVFRINLSGVKTKAELLDAIAKAMKFPDWFGQNFDALADSLTDLAWIPADGYFILLEHCDGIHGYAESDFVATLQIFAQAADEWREQDTPFWCFVDMQADGINWLPDIP